MEHIDETICWNDLDREKNWRFWKTEVVDQITLIDSEVELLREFLEKKDIEFRKHIDNHIKPKRH